MRLTPLKSMLAGLVVSILTLAGWSYAQGRVIVIPYELNLTESEATQEILALKARMSALEDMLACIDPSSDATQITVQGCDVVINADSRVDIFVGGSEITLDSTTLSLKGDGELLLEGGAIRGGNMPVARVGDQVLVNGIPGVITTGNATVLF